VVVCSAVLRRPRFKLGLRIQSFSFLLQESQESAETWFMFLSARGVRGLFEAMEGLEAALTSKPLTLAAARISFSSLKRLIAAGKLIAALSGVSPWGTYV
jgi:hypothetical protein